MMVGELRETFYGKHQRIHLVQREWARQESFAVHELLMQIGVAVAF
jgi:hypothetical protein